MDACTCECHRLRERLTRDMFAPPSKEIRVSHMPADCPCVKRTETDEKK